jgi:hypothetical protein
MTFPNCSGYTPGQQRRYAEIAASAEESSSMTAKSTNVPPQKPRRRSLRGQMDVSVKTEGMKQDLQAMLQSLSSAAASPAMPTEEERKAQVESNRKELFEDQAFQGNESFCRMLTFARTPASQTQPDAVDPFSAAIEQMPAIPQNFQGYGALGDGFSSSESSRSQYMEAISMQMAHAASEVVEDPMVRSQYDQAARNLHEWGERRMQQQQHQQQQNTLATANMGKGGNLLPSISMSLAGISPYALELAARNSLPKKRSSLSKLSKKLMHDWFEHNLHHPYPTEEEKEWLAQQGGITLEQVNNWFINTRGRKWKPMLNRLMAEKQAGNCKLYDQMVEKIEEPYHKL